MYWVRMAVTGSSKNFGEDQKGATSGRPWGDAAAVKVVFMGAREYFK